MSGLMKMRGKLTVAAVTRWCAILAAVVGMLIFGLLAAPFHYSSIEAAQDALKASPSVAQTQPEEEYGVTPPGGGPSIRWNAGGKLAVVANGGGIGVLNGTGKLDYSVVGAHVIANVITDANGVVTYSNVTNGTTKNEYYDGARMWKAGATLGIRGKGIGVLSGTGKLDYNGSGAHVTGDVTADGKGGFVYSNVTNGTTTSKYYDGVRMWKAGAILGIRGNGKGIGVLSGTGKLDYNGSGAHVTGDVTADGKGGFVYSNVTNGTTTSEYWDGVKMWKAGAVLGITDKGIGVLSGTVKLD